MRHQGDYMNNTTKKEVVELVNMQMDGNAKKAESVPNTVVGKIIEVLKKVIKGADKNSEK